jgi:class 3 adenylate cyclase
MTVSTTPSPAGAGVVRHQLAVAVAPRQPDLRRAGAHRRLPGGHVTFMFTDLEGSTRLLQGLGEVAYREALDRHYDLLREALERNGGVEVRTIGDAMFAVFEDPAAAVRAGADIQRAFAAEAWPASTRFAVRIGLHRGNATPHHDDYVGLAVHEAARIAASAHGGQVVLSDAVRQATFPGHDGLWLVSLGEHMLKDFDDPVELHQLAGAGLGLDFPALRTPRKRPHNLRLSTTALIGRAAERTPIADVLYRRAPRLTGGVAVRRRSRSSRPASCCTPSRS